MAILSSKLRSTRHGIMHWCPGCREAHVIYISTPRPNGAVWTWNGSVDKPTCAPSVRLYYTDPDDGQEHTTCHYFLTEGEIIYCGDSAHDLKGRTVPLPDIPDTWGGGEE